MPREEATYSGQPGQPSSMPGAGGVGVNGTGTSAGAIMRKGGSGGKHDMVINAYTLFSFILSFHLASLPRVMNVTITKTMTIVMLQKE